MMNQHVIALLSGSVLLAALSFSSSAATISSVTQVAGNGVIDTLVDVPITLEPNDDNVPFSQNFAFYMLRFEAVAAADIEFGIEASGGSTEYDLFVVLENASGAEWIGMSVELGFGVGHMFVQSGLDGLSFDTDESDPTAERDSVINSRVFLLEDHLDDQIVWGAGVARSPGSDDLAFTFDLPDLTATDRFTLRIQPLVEGATPGTGPPPSVPEPAAGLASLTIGLFASTRRSKGRHSTVG